MSGSTNPSAGEYALTRDQDLDLGGILAAVWRNKAKLLLLSLVATLIAFFVLQSISPQYRSETRILIRASDPVLTSPDAQRVQQQTNFDDSGVADQIQLLQSRSIAMQVINELGLAKKPEFDSNLNRSLLSTMLAIIGLTDGGGVTAADRTLESYYEKLSVFQAERARVVVVQFSSKDPQLAAAVPNLIAREYLAMQEEMKRGAAPDELEKLEPELRRLRKSVMEAEAAVEEFRETSDLLQGRDDDTLATQELSELSTELGRVRSQRSRAEANADAVSRALRSGSLDSAASVLQSPLIQRLRERQVNLNTQLSELSTTLLSGHPRIQALQSQLATLRRQIANEAQKIQVSLQDEAEVARAREEDLVARRNQLKSEAGRVGRAQVELRSLEREADAQRQLLNSYLVDFKEAKARQNRDFVPADAFVFTRAEVQSKPYFPRRLPILSGVFFGTFLLGAMVVMTSSLLSMPRAFAADQHAYARTELEGMMSRSVNETDGVHEPGRREKAALVPSLKSLTESVPSDRVLPMSLAAKSLSMLGRARIVITSPEGEVTSHGAAVLSRILASRGHSVVVLDMTGQGSATKLLLGQDSLVGIRDLLAGSASFSDAIHNDSHSSVHVMPIGTNAVLASGSTKRLPTVIDALDATYDYLIVDCGSPDVSGLKRVCHSETVLIIDTADPSSPSVGLIGSMLKQAGFRAPLLAFAGEEERQYAGLVSA